MTRHLPLQSSDQRGRPPTCNALLGWCSHSFLSIAHGRDRALGAGPRCHPPQARPGGRGASCALLPCQSGNVVITSRENRIAIWFVQGNMRRLSMWCRAARVNSSRVNSSEAEGNGAA
jgi:hypothetical protein